jgi:hypothetical protein
MSGLWEVEGLPHRGWTCLYVTDLGEPTVLCEMCGTRTLRYVHAMAHDDHPEALHVGCVCAEHMALGYRDRGRRNEQRLAARACRRERFLTIEWASKRTWRALGMTPARPGGQPWGDAERIRARKEGARVFLVAQRGGTWFGALYDGERWRGRGLPFRSEREVRAAMFDYVWPARIEIATRRRRSASPTTDNQPASVASEASSSRARQRRTPASR